MRLLIGSFAGILLLAAVVSFAVARQDSDTGRIEALGSVRGWIIEGRSADRKIWIQDHLGKDGALVSLDADLSRGVVHYEDGVVAIRKSANGLLVLRAKNLPDRESLERGSDFTPSVQIARWNGNRFVSGAWLDLEKNEYPLGLVLERGWPVVLTSKAVYEQAGDVWQQRRLTGDRLRFDIRVFITAPVSGGSAYVGTNRGEWGGGVQRIDLSSGVVSDIEAHERGEHCKAPLDSACDPVTGMEPDSNRPNCILAAIGLRHFGSHGRVVRICPGGVDVVLERTETKDDGSRSEWSEALSELVVFAGEFWTTTYDSEYRHELISEDKETRSKAYNVKEASRRHTLYQVRDGRVTKHEMPELENAGTLYFGRPDPRILLIVTHLEGPLDSGQYYPQLVALD